ncbi:MAG: hypothetical protein P1Q69_05950 [Candidatus Thorarchaeota archaeon]|nr:hypothetical protein [Candidatus Thorarchaeota archaeon]
MSDKVQVTVFMPVGQCSCSQTGFLGRINEAVSKHRNIIDYTQESAGSEEAIRLGIRYRAIKVGERILKSNPTAAQIEEAIITEARLMRLIKEDAV